MQDGLSRKHTEGASKPMAATMSELMALRVPLVGRPKLRVSDVLAMIAADFYPAS